MKQIIRDAAELTLGPVAVLVCLLGGDPDKLKELINDKNTKDDTLHRTRTAKTIRCKNSH